MKKTILGMLLAGALVPLAAMATTFSDTVVAGGFTTAGTVTGANFVGSGAGLTGVSMTYTNSATLSVSNSADNGAATLTLQSDKGDDAGDKFGVVSLNGTLAVQSDISVKGTLATKASYSSDGTINTLTGLDGIGAIDLDIGSVDVTDVTIITDGGTFDVGTVANTATLTAGTTDTAVFTGADASGAANTAYDTTGAGAITIGSADVTAITLTTDATGDGSDVVLPTGAIQSAEILDATIVNADISATAEIAWSKINEVSGSVTQLVATSLQLTSSYYGQLVVVATNAAVAITLPANGATRGSWIEIAVGAQRADLLETDSCVPTIAAATADTLITLNSTDSDSVTWNSGHRIGARARFWSDGFFWHVTNQGANTMTVTDSD